MISYKLKSKVSLYPGMTAWHLMYLPKLPAKKIRTLFGKGTPRFGSLPVKATIGQTSWDTSIFCDKKTSTYILPLNIRVRKKENIKAEQTIAFTIVIRL